MRTEGIVTTFLASAGSSMSPRARMSDAAWRINSPTRSPRCDGPPLLWDGRGMDEFGLGWRWKQGGRRGAGVVAPPRSCMAAGG
jgi:hypothetical protein